MTPGQRGRWIGRRLIAVAVLATGLAVFGFIAASGGPTPMFSTPPDLWGLPVNAVLPAAGMIGLIIGLAWMIRIHRTDPEPDQRAWRYRRRSRGSPSLGRWISSMTPGQRGRWIGRGMIAIAVLAIGLTVMWFIAGPGFTVGLSTGLRSGLMPVDLLLMLIGIVGPVVGLVWMIRIHRADPEPDQHAWRYRAHGR